MIRLGGDFVLRAREREHRRGAIDVIEHLELFRGEWSARAGVRSIALR